jgi:hypothetical protein
MASSMLKKKYWSPGSIVSSLVALPVVFVICLAIWLAFASVMENMRFAQATNQLVGVISGARDYAAREKNFAMLPGEDLLNPLARTGLVPNIEVMGGNAQIINPWSGVIRATTVAPSTMRIETFVPVRDCRRMALMLVRDARELGLQLMEAREGSSIAWRRFFEGNNNHNLDSRPIEAACGQWPQATLALVFGLR